MNNIGSTNYILIGNGRLAKNLAHYFTLKNVAFAKWNRNSNSIEDLKALINIDSIVLLSISDDAVIDFINQNSFLKQAEFLIHFSGSLSTTLATGMHPLMTFSHELKDLKFYENILFVCEGYELSFTDIFPQLSNPCINIPSAHKALYHALCVLLGNGSQLLWQNTYQELNKLGIPNQFLDLYLKTNIQNFIESREHALTGPWVRGDTKTIQNNLKALGTSSLRSVYEALWQLFNFKKENSHEKHI